MSNAVAGAIQRRTQQVGQGLRGIACYRQCAALFGAILRERGQNDVGARSEQLYHLVDLPFLLSWIVDEVQHRAIVPQLKAVVDLSFIVSQKWSQCRPVLALLIE